ncbi:ribonuclease D [Commensalibacter nepenthis]|uniref:Ribonuclease D n=1 Tax=Commensalibacter nepenthis TaxID=3043872 RepID=A0ABT6Q9M2_9PROT|nr:ribonuclease D [Commensalibacter sp. TBRC 10068]MDI2113608.1 ribonuclease D [Commensalibacter sp. TBRC 10068]
MAVSEPSTPDYIHLYQHDLPDALDLGSIVAIDTEAMGLNHYRDRLCLVQLSSGDGQVHLVQFVPEYLGGTGFTACPNLVKILTSPSVTKIMHFARFDVGILQHSLNIKLHSVICTKIAAKLVRTFTDKHGLAALCRDILKIELCKQQQSSDWGALTLTPEQLVYAASDVLYLHQLWNALEQLLIRENRLELAQSCFSFLPTRADLDILGYEEPDIFQHRSY